jgi:hypothetical protein
MKGCAIVSLVFLKILHDVPQRVSATHSMAINGLAINEAGALHNL